MENATSALLPTMALSVRQPWAWAIIHAGKDIENRSQGAVRHMDFTKSPRIAIHAAKGMTREEYEDAAEFMADVVGVKCPLPADLLRAGIIGSVAVAGVVKESPSDWFFGPRGLMLKNPEACALIPSVGALGLFKWSEANPSIIPAPAKWMLPPIPATRPNTIEKPLFAAE